MRLHLPRRHLHVARAEPIQWRCITEVDKRWGDDPSTEPYERLRVEGNLLVYGGASALWDLLKAGGNVTAYSNANAHLGVGDSSTAAAATQTDLQAATNKLRKPMEATYPLHTDGTTDGSDDIVFRAVFATGDANWVWNEWGTFNHVSAGRMLNRKVENLGTKTSAASWTLTVTLSLS